MSLLVRSSTSTAISTPSPTEPVQTAPVAKKAAVKPASSFTRAAAPKSASSLSQKGVDLIKGFEGLRLNSYQDSGGVWTIGYGHTGSDVRPGQSISRTRAEELLRHDTGWAQDAVRSSVKVPLTQGQFDALTSFTFNLGAGALRSSTLLKKLNAHDYAGAQQEFGKWVHAGGQVLAGLVRRRATEAKMFGDRGPSATTQPGQPTPPPPVTPPSTTKTDYRVRAGDTMSGIAARKKMSLSQLIALNPQVKDPNKIHVGELLHVAERRRAPRTVDYTVRSGDTFSGIASSHRLTVRQLQTLNPQVKDINRIFPGQKLHLRAAAPAPAPAPHDPTPTPTPTPTPHQPTPAPDAALHAGMPNTSGMSQNKRFALYSNYINQYGDAQAKKDLAAGKRVVLALRQDTPMTSDKPSLGTFDDRMVVLWKDASGSHVKELAANTEPNRRWSIPANESSKPVGRLADGQSVRYHKAWSTKFGDHLEPYGNPYAQRDANRDYRFEKNERSYNGDWGGQAMFIHRGYTGNTGSQGCQTLDPSHFDSFWSSLGSQRDFSYVLLNVTK